MDQLILMENSFLTQESSDEKYISSTEFPLVAELYQKKTKQNKKQPVTPAGAQSSLGN